MTGGTLSEQGPVVLYDGVCGLCNRCVRFVLRRNSRRHIRFATLQGPFAAETLARHGIDATSLESLALVLDPAGPSERVATKSRAVAGILRELGPGWRMLSVPVRLLGDRLYDAVARRRYRWFGKLEACPVAEASVRNRFLD